MALRSLLLVAVWLAAFACGEDSDANTKPVAGLPPDTEVAELSAREVVGVCDALIDNLHLEQWCQLVAWENAPSPEGCQDVLEECLGDGEPPMDCDVVEDAQGCDGITVGELDACYTDCASWSASVSCHASGPPRPPPRFDASRAMRPPGSDAGTR